MKLTEQQVRELSNTIANLSEYHYERNESVVFSVDFDGILVEEKYPEIGEPFKYIINILNIAQKQFGHKLILNTCRQGSLLEQAVAFCKSHDLFFNAINENLPERIEKYGGDCRKISADYDIDDRSIWLLTGAYEESVTK